MDLYDISQEEFERIEAYINGELSSQNLTTFEAKLKSDDRLALKVDEVKTILIGLETQILKVKLDVFHSELTSDAKTPVVHEPKVRTLNWKRLAIAAILVIGLGSFWFLNQNTNERLYSEYFSPDPGLPTTMSSTNQYEFYEAMVSYKQGKYNSAIKKWETLHKTEQDNDTLNYFIGVAHLANKSEHLAIPYLENAVENSAFTLLNDAYFYLGLAHLKNKNTEKAKEYLRKSSLESSKSLLTELEY